MPKAQHFCHGWPVLNGASETNEVIIVIEASRSQSAFPTEETMIGIAHPLLGFTYIKRLKIAIYTVKNVNKHKLTSNMFCNSNSLMLNKITLCPCGVARNICIKLNRKL